VNIRTTPWVFYAKEIGATAMKYSNANLHCIARIEYWQKMICLISRSCNKFSFFGGFAIMQQGQINFKVALMQQGQIIFQASMLQCSKVELIFRRGCCNVARANHFSGEVAAMQQGQINFQASLLQCSKGKLIFRRGCCNVARANKIPLNVFPTLPVVFPFLSEI